MSDRFFKSAAWHEQRRLGIGGSDALSIMSGRWTELWEIKTGSVEPEDLSGVLPVQLGLHTEELNLCWFERETGYQAGRRGESVTHPYYDFMRCTLDGFVDEPGCCAVVQAKWSNPWSKIEEIEQRYMAQVHHEMMVCGCERAFLSIITGKPSYELVEIRCDDDYLAELIAREITFWGYVERREPPPTVAPVAAKARPAVYRTADMSNSNSWAENAWIWCETIEDSRRCDKAAKELRALVESDVGTAAGHGVVITRSKDGRSLYLKEVKS
jgi:predicted phage-related endonuclease